MWNVRWSTTPRVRADVNVMVLPRRDALAAVFHRTTSGYLSRFPHLADFDVAADGQYVCCHPATDVSDETVAIFTEPGLTSRAEPARQGWSSMQAAVELDGNAVVFIGEAGRGKSTLAAGFATSGFRFLTDDGLVIDEQQGGYKVLPSHPSIRLWEDSRAALFHQEPPALPPLPFHAQAPLSGRR